MFALLLSLFRLVWLLGKGQRDVVLENLALRQQLSIYQRKQKRPRLTRGRPLVLDDGLGDVEELAASSAHRPSRHGGALAAGAFSPALGRSVQ